MKMKEEQDALKEETDTMKGKTAELSEDKLNHVVGGFGTGEVVVTSYSFNVGDWFEDWNMLPSKRLIPPASSLASPRETISRASFVAVNVSEILSLSISKLPHIFIVAYSSSQ